MPGTLHDKVDRLEELKDYLNIFIEERTTRAATSSCHHQIIHPLQVMVKFLSTLGHVDGPSDAFYLYRISERDGAPQRRTYTKRSIVRCDRLDDRPQVVVTDRRSFWHSNIRYAHWPLQTQWSIVRRQMEGICDTANTSVKKALMSRQRILW
jgi:hypothetical protein